MDQPNQANPLKPTLPPVPPQTPHSTVPLSVTSGFSSANAIKRPVAPPDLGPQDLSFLVMPQSGAEFAQQAGGGNVENNSLGGLPMEPETGGSKRKLLFIILAVIGVLIIAAGAYYIFVLRNKNTEDVSTSKLPKVFLQQYFGADTCSDQARCGDDADPDSDGLGNYDEFKDRTSPIDNDSDNDGLADGDEVNIYGTNPINKYTDSRTEIAETNGYNDGVEIKNGYNPLTPGLKITDEQKAQISANTSKYGLHEPTITTMTVLPPVTPTTPPAAN
jgi:hypothetical protein